MFETVVRVYTTVCLSVSLSHTVQPSVCMYEVDRLTHPSGCETQEGGVLIVNEEFVVLCGVGKVGSNGIGWCVQVLIRVRPPNAKEQSHGRNGLEWWGRLGGSEIFVAR